MNILFHVIPLTLAKAIIYLGKLVLFMGKSTEIFGEFYVTTI